MFSINDRIPQLDIQQVQLNWIVGVDILIREEKLLSECEYDGFFNSLIIQCLVYV